MIIQHNIMALNAHRQLSGNTSQVSKNIEKLSSGFKINRAGDDASGLAISEKMRAQIKGLEVAQKNAQDGISLIQTAEGALTEVHSMLNRMVELAEKSANGTVQNTVDRGAIQKEVDDLLKEIDRISQATNFNGINLLGGNTKVAAEFTAAGAPVPATPGVAVFDLASVTTDVGDKLTIQGVAFTFAAGQTISDAIDAYNADGGSTWTATLNGNTLTLTSDATGAGVAAAPSVSRDPDGTPVSLTATSFTAGKDATVTANAVVTYDMSGKSLAEGSVFKIGDSSYTVKAGDTLTQVATGISVSGYTASAVGNDIVLTATAPGAAVNPGDAEFDSADPNPEFSLTLQIGDSNDGYQKVDVQIDDLSSVGLGINGLKVDTQEAAGAAIADIKAAINKVSTNRANLGGLQNRLEHTVNNLAVTEENMTAAESRIRDVDMAKEMMAFTKNNVLTQAAQAMLAQANTQPQSVLQLLR